MDEAIRAFNLVAINQLQARCVSVPIIPTTPRVITEIIIDKLVYLSFDRKRDHLITLDCLALVASKVDRSYMLDLISQMISGDYDSSFISKLVEVNFTLYPEDIKAFAKIGRAQYCLDLALAYPRIKGSFKLLEKASRSKSFCIQITDPRLVRLIPKLRYAKLHKRAILCLRYLLSQGFSGYPVAYLNSQINQKIGFNYYIAGLLTALDFIQTISREEVLAIFSIIDQNPMIDICSSADVIFKLRKRFGINSRGYEFTNVALKTLYESVSIIIDAPR